MAHPAENILKPVLDRVVVMDTSAAASALAVLFPFRNKAAGVIDELHAVKAESDRRNWPAKHARLHALMKSSPDDWYIDSADNGIVGVTHKTGYRFHMPRHRIPDAVRQRPVGQKPWEQNQPQVA